MIGECTKLLVLENKLKSNMKKTYIIPCSWQVTGKYHIEADNLQQALQIAEDSNLPEDCDFLEGSFEIDKDMIPFENELTKEEIKDL